MIREFEGDMTPAQTALHMAFYHNRRSCISPGGFLSHYGLSMKNMAAVIGILSAIRLPELWRVRMHGVAQYGGAECRCWGASSIAKFCQLP